MSLDSNGLCKTGKEGILLLLWAIVTRRQQASKVGSSGLRGGKEGRREKGKVFLLAGVINLGI